MKNMVFKAIGAICFFAAVSDAAMFADAAVHGKESRLAADFDEIKKAVRDKRAAKKAAKADEPEVS